MDQCGWISSSGYAYLYIDLFSKSVYIKIIKRKVCQILKLVFKKTVCNFYSVQLLYLLEIYSIICNSLITLGNGREGVVAPSRQKARIVLEQILKETWKDIICYTMDLHMKVISAY